MKKDVPDTRKRLEDGYEAEDDGSKNECPAPNEEWRREKRYGNEEAFTDARRQARVRLVEETKKERDEEKRTPPREAEACVEHTTGEEIVEETASSF